MAKLQGLDQDVSALFQSHVQTVRLFMRDFAEFNLLIRGEESSDRMIAWATLDFLSNFNGTPPFTTHSLTGLYDRQMQSFCVRGTTISLLQSVMLLYVRNHLPFSDGGLSVNFNDKAPIIQSMLALFQSAYEQDKRLIKTTFNVEQLLEVSSGGLHSDYTVLSGLGYYN